MVDRLIPHPLTPSQAVDAVEVTMKIEGRAAVLTYRSSGDEPVSPPFAPPGRADGLWQHTCFELFVKPAGGEGYFEFNFSPSTQWAAYRFDSYRSGMADLSLAAPLIEPVEHGIRVTIDLSGLPPGNWRVGLAAVIEEKNGTKSYWALAHPPGKPDFHHPDCFVLELPPA